MPKSDFPCLCVLLYVIPLLVKVTRLWSTGFMDACIKNKCTRDLKTDQENLSSQAIQIESNGLKICSKLTVRTQPGGFDMVWMCCVVVGIRIHRCEALR